MDGSKVFRLMDLPFVVFRKVMYELEFFSVLNLTLVSRNTKKQVRSCSLKAMDVELKLTKDFSNVLNVVYKGDKYSWGLIETVNATAQGEMITPVNENLFKPTCSQILFILNKKSVDTFRFDRTIKEADITQYWDILEGVTDIYIASCSVSFDEMILVVGRFKKLRNLFIDPSVPQGFQGLENRKLDILYLEGERNIFSLEQLQANILLMQTSSLEKREINSFIKNWLTPGEPPRRSEPTVIRIFKVDTDLTILDGVKRHAWNPKHRSQFYIVILRNGVMAIDCSGGFDIYRSDGVMATVLFKNNTFDFLVWTDRFHKVPEGAVHS